MDLLVVLMFIFMIMKNSVYDFKKLTVKRFSYESNEDMMKINISCTFNAANVFTANVNQWVKFNFTYGNVNMKQL